MCRLANCETACSSSKCCVDDLTVPVRDNDLPVPTQTRIFSYRSISVCVILLLLFVAPELTEANPLAPNTVSTNGGTCGSRCMQAIAHARKEQIKKDLLDRLGLERPPNVSVSRDLPLLFDDPNLPVQWAGAQSDQDLADLFAMDQPREYKRSRTEMIVTFGKTGAVEGNAYFNYSRKDYNMYVKAATLRVYVQPTGDGTDGKVNLTMRIYGMDKSGQRSSRPMSYIKFLHSLSSGQWVTVGGLSNHLNEWFRQQRSQSETQPFVLYAEAMHNGVNLAQTPRSDGNTSHAMHMSIEVSTLPDESASSRSKRSIQLDCDGDGKEQRCCRAKLRIEFAEFNWDWIIAPKYYDAYMCAGSCDANHLTSTIHGHVAKQQQLHAHRHRHSGGKHGRRHHGNNNNNNHNDNSGSSNVTLPRLTPCCHPTEYSDLKIVYMKEKDTIEVTTVPNMVAQRCGCA